MNDDKRASCNCLDDAQSELIQIGTLEVEKCLETQPKRVHMLNKFVFLTKRG